MDFRGDGRRRLPSLAGRFPSPSDSLGESPEGFNRWRTSRAAAADNLHDRPLQPKLVALLGQDQAGSWRPAERTTRRETTASGRCGHLSAERRETAGLPAHSPGIHCRDRLRAGGSRIRTAGPPFKAGAFLDRLLPSLQLAKQRYSTREGPAVRIRLPPAGSHEGCDTQEAHQSRGRCRACAASDGAYLHRGVTRLKGTPWAALHMTENLTAFVSVVGALARHHGEATHAGCARLHLPYELPVR
jgi:hypothetical protein